MCIALLVVSLLNPFVPCFLFGGWVQLCFLPRVACLISAEVLMFFRRAAAVAFGLLFRRGPFLLWGFPTSPKLHWNYWK